MTIQMTMTMRAHFETREAHVNLLNTKKAFVRLYVCLPFSKSREGFGSLREPE